MLHNTNKNWNKSKTIFTSNNSYNNRTTNKNLLKQMFSITRARTDLEINRTTQRKNERLRK